VNPEITIKDQVSCVERELALRQRVYPRWVSERRMPQEKADREIQAMEAVLQTLKRNMALAEVSEEIKGQGKLPI
jgi:hypothetical protein